PVEFTEKFVTWLNANSLYKAVGITVEGASRGKARARMDPDPALCWPFAAQPHGGILFTFMDTTMGCAVLSELEPGLNCSTINSNIQYTAPAKGNGFICEAQITHKTGRMTFARSEIYDRAGTLLATGQATFRIVKDDFSLGA
ncbi:MAG: PaaI family thioesterase, partial [Deltaproteobacteria bacterium]